MLVVLSVGRYRKHVEILHLTCFKRCSKHCKNIAIRFDSGFCTDFIFLSFSAGRGTGPTPSPAAPAPHNMTNIYENSIKRVRNLQYQLNVFLYFPKIAVVLLLNTSRIL